MLTMKWRVTVARTLILVMVGNPVIIAAHGMERTAKEHLVKQAAEQRELARVRQQLSAVQLSSVQTVAQATAPVSTGVSLANGQQAGIKTSANGTTVIDIAAPSQRGVSHNRFNHFNVPAEGLILNNSKDPLISVLGGWTDGNRRLSGGTAGLILAEVTGTGRSSLLGYTEVLGDAAEFVLANPNGITCNGCGFINTPRVVLATGIPDLLNGELAGINISGGDVRIEGEGLNAANVSKFDILTRAMQLNAALYADELNIRTGSNYYDFRTGQLQANADQAAGSPAYQFALDASALGAMYANSISLIGTEKGLGVRSDGLINSVDSLQLTADGQLQLKDTVAGGNLTLGSQQADIITSGTTYGQNVNIELAGTLHNSGVIAAADTMQVVASGMQQSGDLIAGVNLQGEWQQTAAQQLNISGELVNQGRIISQGQQTLAADQLQNDAGALVQGDIANISSQSLVNQGIINSTSLTLAANSAQSSGHIQAQQLNINTRQFSLLDGMLYQSGANGSFNFSGENLLVAGGLLAADGATKVNVSGEIQNNTSWLAAGSASISAASIINSGTLQLLAGADVTADTLNNSGNMLFAGEQAAALNISNKLDNQAGLLQFSSNALLSGATINNDGGQIYHLGQGDLSVEATGQLSNRSGEILSNGSMQLSAAQIENQQGTLSAEQLVLSATNINSQAGNIQAGLLDITAQQLNNQQGSIAALGGSGQSLQLNISDTLDNSQGFILAKGQQLSLSTKQLINDQGSLLLSGADGLTINASGQLRNQQGLIHSGGGLLLNTPLLNNNQGEISARDINISAATLNNQQGVIGAQQVTLDGAYLDNRAGNIGAFSAAGHNLTLNFSQAIDNSAQGIIQSAADVAVITSRQLNNTDGNIVLAGSNGSLQVSATTLQNQQGQIQTNGQLLLTADNVQNQAGYIAALGDVSINATSVNNSAGQILADKLLLNTAQLTNTDGMILVQNELNLHSPLLANLRGIISAQTLNITGNTLDNTGGQLLAAEELNISTGQLTNLDGVINSQQTLQLSAAELNNRSGVIQGVSSFDAQVQGSTDNHSGQLLAGANLQLHSELLDNTQGTVAAGGQLNIHTTELQNSEAGVISGTALNITATTLRNEAQARIEGQQLQLTSRVIDNAGTLLAAGQQGDSLVLLTDVLNNQGRIESHGENLSLTNVQLNNQQGQIYHLGTGVLQLEFLAELNNRAGEMYSAGQLSMHGGNISNSSGLLIAQQALLLNAAQLDNSEGVIQTSGSLAGVVTELNNQQGQLIAATDLQLAGTDISNIAGVIHAGEELDISGTSLINQGGKISAAGQNYQLAISGAVDNSLDGILTTAGNMAITAAGLNNSSGLIYQQGDGSLLLQVDNTLNNTDGTIAAADLAVTADRLNNNTGLIQGGAVDISTALLNNNAGTIYQQGSATQLSINSGSLTNDAGQISALADANISAGQLSNNAGRIESGSALHLSGGALNNDSGNLVANNINMQLTGALSNNQGTLFAADTLTIAADSIDNTLGTLAANAGLQLTAATALTNNQGLLQAAGSLVASAQHIDNSAGTIQAATAQLNAQQSINNAAGVINAQTLALSTAALNNSYGVILATDTSDNSLQLTEVGQLNNSNGTVASHGRNWDFTLEGLNNNNGKLLHLGTGTFTLSQAGNLANTGTIASNANLVINAGNVSNSGTLQAQQQLQLNSGVANHAGAVLVANNITLNAAANSITNAGSISAANNLQLGAASVTNSHLLYAGNNALVNAANVSNSGTWSANNLNVSGFNLLQNSGRIESNTATYTGNTLQNQASGMLVNAATAANSLQLNVGQLTNSGTLYNNASDMSVGGNLNNSGSIIHAGTGNLLLGNNGSINNAGGSIASAGVATLQSSIIGAGTVYAEQGMLINGSGTFTNNSQLYTKGNMQVNSSLHNQGGSLLSDGNLTINTAGSVTNSGSLQGQNLSLTSGALNNKGGTITSTGTNNAQISAASLSNSGGVIQATNNNFSLITRSGELNNSNGQIKHGGNGVLTLQSASHLNQQSGLVQSAGQLVATAQGNLNNSYGVLSASQYQLTSSGTLNNNIGQIVGTGVGSSSIQSGTLLNRSGHIAANGTNLTLNSAALDNNNGSILLAGSGNLAITASSVANDAANSRIISNGGISLNSGSALNNAGVISAANLFTLTGTNLTNSGTLASRSGKVDIDSSGTLTNSGTISGATAVELDVRTLNNASGKVQSDGKVAITVNSLSVGQIYGRDLQLSSNNSIALQNGELLSASRNLQLNSNGNITNSGNIIASGTLNLDATDLTNNATGVIRAGGNAVLDLNRLTNNGIVSSNTVLTLNADNTTNTGTLAAGNHLDINGNIDNRNLLFAGSLLTIDGNVSNTANIYSNQDAVISGATVTNTGGTIAAARDVSISGNILNTYTGQLTYVEGNTSSSTHYPDGDPMLGSMGSASPTSSIAVLREDRTTTNFEATLTNGRVGVIAAGRNMTLSGIIANNASTISAMGNLVLSGTGITNTSLANKQVILAEQYDETWAGGCIQGETRPPYDSYWCAEPGFAVKTNETYIGSTSYTINTGGTYGTIVAGGNITGNLSGELELNDGSLVPAGSANVNTNANGSSGSASRGSNAGASNSGTVAVNRSNGTSQNTSGANRSANGVAAGNNGTVDAGWRDNNSPQPGNTEPQIIADNPTQPAPVDTAIDADNRQLNAGDLLQKGDIDIGPAKLVATQGNVRNVQVTDPAWQQADAMQAGMGVQGIGFMSPDMAASLQVSQGTAPQGPGQQQGGGQVGNGNIAGSGNYNPDLIIKGLVDNQQGTLAQQKNSAQQQSATQGNSANGQQVGQNVFITDEQMRVLTEDLGFDANAINKGQQALYAAISQNDLLADGVTLSAGGTIDITADAGFNINSGIAAGEGLILRSEGGLNMGNFGFFDSENLLGLQLGGDFTNTMNLQSDTLWLDIGGDFTNLGSLTGSDVLSISAGNNLINQNLLSGGHVLLNAGGDIINRTEFSQHTVNYDNGNSKTYTTVGKAPQIISNDSLSMTAGNNIDLQGSKFSAAGDISLNAGNDVLLGAVEKLSGHEKYFKGGHDIELHRTYDVVSFDAGGNLSVVAGNNLQSEGAQFSTGGIAALSAGEEMNLLAVVESHYYADKKTKKSTFKKKITETVSLHEQVQGTSITAGNILLNATVDEAGNVVQLPGGNITMVGSNLNAEQNIIAFGNDITVTAGTYQDYDYSHTSKSSFGGLKSKSREDLAQDDLLAGSELTAGGNILLNAGNDIAILASELRGDNIGLTAFNEVLIASGEESSIRESRSQSGGFFSGGSLFSSSEALAGSASITADSSVINASGNIIIDAGSATVIGSVLDAEKGISVKTDIGDIQVLAAKETTETYSREQNISVSFGDALKALTRPDELLKAEDGQLKLSLGSATYDKVDFASNATDHKASELTAGEGIQLDSVADIKIEGSAINADGDVNLLAGGDVIVKEATDSYSETREEVNGKAEISLVVQHQAVEVAKAAKAVDDAKDQVKQAEADYRKYQKEKDQLETTLAQLEADYQNKVPGVNYSDIVELRNLLDDVNGDEAWYLAGIATASANLVSKTTLLGQQTAAAAQSGATYGFNAGLQLDIAASKTDSSLDATSSAASTINGNNINIVTGSNNENGPGQSGNTLIQGSALNASQNLNIFTGELNVLASQDTQRSETDTQSGTMTVAQTVWGAAGGPTVNASLNSSQQQDKQTTHNNASLSADNLNIVTSGDANIIGGNLHGATAVNMDIGGDLTLESVQDRFSGSNKGFGISGGISLGGVFTNENGAAANSKEAKTTAVGQSDGVSGVNGGVNAQSGRYQTTETVLSSITGGTVNIDVNGNTQLTGALIAALDEEGNDTGNLSLNTGSLSFTDLSNRSYSSNQSFGVSGSVGIGGKESPGDPNQTNINSSNYSYQNESSQSLDKSLATIGQGNITVGGEETSPEGLNRDVDNIDKELYAVDRQQGNIDLTVDHRLLSEEGRKQIAEDAKRTEILGSAIVDIVESSVSLTGSGEGEDSLRDHIGNTQDYFTATKNFTQNADNAEHMATLANDNATPEQKQAAYTALVNEIATYLGVDPTEAKVLMQNDPQFAGAFSRDTDAVYVNDLAHNNATDAVNTVGHETQHYLDNQQNPNAERTEQYIANREEYAGIMGEATADYLGFNFAQNGSALANANNHSLGTTADEILSNLNALASNSQQYKSENPDQLDYNILRALPAIEKGAGLAVLGAVALSGDEDARRQFAQDAETLINDVNTVLGRDSASAGKIDSEYIINELIALKVKEDKLNDSRSQDYQAYNEIYALRSTLLTDLSPEQRAAIENNVSEFVTGVLSGGLTSSGGFPVAVEPVITTLTNPLPENVTPTVLDNTPPPVSGQTGGFEQGESLPPLEGTPVHEGHWSDNVYLREDGESRPDQGALDLLSDSSFKDRLSDVECTDCDDIAKLLYKAAGSQGQILDLTIPGGWINVEEFGKIESFADHRVFSDGKFIFDPRLSKDPVPIQDYLNNIKKLNPNVVVKDVTP